MEVQSECVEPPVAPQCDPSPQGRSTKLPSNSSETSVELVRSKTHDGLTSDTDGQRGRGSPAWRRGRGLKGFFSSMRWRRKEKTNEGEGEEVEGNKEKDGDGATSEKLKDITLTLEPPPHHHQEDCGNEEAEPNRQATETPIASVTMTPPHCVAIQSLNFQPHPSLATPPLDRCSTGDPPSEPSVDRLCSLLFTDVTSLKSFDSLTGCGDIIADADDEGPAGNGGSGTSSSSSGGGGGVWEQVSGELLGSPAPPGSGVVAYMVDDADMQGLWHMLPSTGDNSPPPGVQTERYPSDEGYWDTPSATPTATPDESGLQRNQKMALSRDSCSGDHLYDLYNDPEEEGDDEEQEGDEDLNSTPSPSTEYKLSPTTPPSSSSSSSFRSMKGSTSLPRESKIPVSTRPTPPPHSVSQSALSSVLEAESPPPKTQAPPPARTRIPVSKVPVRRSGNKAGSRGTAHKK
uniref:APC membrane recruitment protein 2 n=1 Tax=Lates calcarifer TaxID=8187 RepID=A0A4W6DEH6_LATCA